MKEHASSLRVQNPTLTVKSLILVPFPLALTYVSPAVSKGTEIVHIISSKRRDASTQFSCSRKITLWGSLALASHTEKLDCQRRRVDIPTLAWWLCALVCVLVQPE